MFLFFLCSGFVTCLFTLNPTFLVIWLITLRVLIGGAFLVLLNSWIRYAVILLFTGGIIVLFSYILSLIISSKIRFFSFTKFVLFFWVTTLLFSSIELLNNRLFITNLFFKSRNFILLVLALYLLLVLLRIVNLARSNRGPIKSFFTYEQ